VFRNGERQDKDRQRDARPRDHTDTKEMLREAAAALRRAEGIVRAFGG
jgi:hypothetical protein